MTKDEYRGILRDLVYLVSCAAGGTAPDQERVAAMDLRKLYREAERHLLTAAAAMALERAGIRNAAFTQAKGKAIRKVAALDEDRAALFAALEQQAIWYLPLKGCVMKEYYPAYGMRQMSDNDILIDASRAADARNIMLAMGFTSESYNAGVHDTYHKEPVSNFELHRALFGPARDRRIQNYYADVKKRLIKDEGNRYGWHFSPEDFYVYMIAHEHKHYAASGTGLRSLLDVFVYWERFGASLDGAYLRGELEKLGLADFERENRVLALRLFRNEVLSEPEQAMLDYIGSSGAYGTMANSIRKQITEKGRAGYFFARMFLPCELMQTLYPILRRFPVLLPVCWVLRLVSAVLRKPKVVWYQLRACFTFSTKECGLEEL